MAIKASELYNGKSSGKLSPSQFAQQLLSALHEKPLEFAKSKVKEESYEQNIYVW